MDDGAAYLSPERIADAEDARLTEAQALVVDILHDLLSSAIGDTDAAIDRALARLGKFCEADRSYVIVVDRANHARNSHEWVADGIVGMKDSLQDLPFDLVADWMPAFLRNEPVYVADAEALPPESPMGRLLRFQAIRSLLIVPMRHEGRFLGFVGHDWVRARRGVTSGEVYLLKSMADVICSVLMRRNANAEIEASRHALEAERDRLRATLNAMPGLVLELDDGARLVGCHPARQGVFSTLDPSVLGRHVGEALEPELARIVLGAVARGERGTGEYRLAMADWQGWVELSVAPLQGPESGQVVILRDVTPRHRALEELRYRDELFRGLFAFSPAGFALTDPEDGRIIDVNPALLARTGYRHEDLVGSDHRLLVVDAFHQTVRDGLDEIVASGSFGPVEIELRDRQGAVHPVLISGSEVVDANGRRLIWSVLEDIGQSRRHAAALEALAREADQARLRLHSAVEALPDGFALYDTDDRLVLCNSRYREHFPRSGAAIEPGVAFADILRHGLALGEYPDAVGCEEEWLASRLARSDSDVSEHDERLADGRWLKVLVRRTPEGGRVALRVDITDLKRAEERAVAERAAAMDASRDGIFITDAEGRFTYINRAGRAMFGFSEGESPRYWGELYASEEEQFLREIALPIVARTGSWRGEVVGRSRDGRPVDQEVTLTRSAQDRIICIARDISARRRADAERMRLREELHLAQRREIIGRIAAGLAHDFNNLLAVISGSVGLLRIEGGLPAAAETHLGRIASAAGQAAGLVRRLTQIGAPRPTHRRIDLRAPLRESADLVRAVLSAGATLEVDVPEAPVMARADPADILQILLNLAMNARDARPRGRNRIRLALEPLASREALCGSFAVGKPDPELPHACFSVSDTGPGMDRETLASAFRPYFSTKGAEGTGLGLPVVASLASANGAAVAVETASGQGTCFRVYWPLAERGAPASAAPRETGEAPGRLDGRTILLVDDSEAMLRVFGAFLEQAGAEVAPCLDPRDALEALAEDPGAWDLLITDFDMEAMDGASLVEAAQRHAPEIPAILVTALADWPQRQNQSRPQFAAVMGKPVSGEALVTAAVMALESGLSARASTERASRPSDPTETGP